MGQTSALRTLRRQLSDLYDSLASIRVLVDDVGLDAVRINLSGSADEVWYHVLRAAQHQNKVAALVNAASAAYPARASELAHAYQRDLPPAPASDHGAARPQQPMPAIQSGDTSMNPDLALPYDLFISYSHRDATWVRSVLLPRLEADGLRVCIDMRDFALGAPLITEIERAVLQSRKTLLVLTPDYLASQWTEFENILVATLDPAARARRMLPILLKASELPLRIRHLNYLDFTQPDDPEFRWRRLVAALRERQRFPEKIVVEPCRSGLVLA